MAALEANMFYILKFALSNGAAITSGFYGPVKLNSQTSYDLDSPVLEQNNAFSIHYLAPTAPSISFTVAAITADAAKNKPLESRTLDLKWSGFNTAPSPDPLQYGPGFGIKVVYILRVNFNGAGYSFDTNVCNNVAYGAIPTGETVLPTLTAEEFDCTFAGMSVGIEIYKPLPGDFTGEIHFQLKLKNPGFKSSGV